MDLNEPLYTALKESEYLLDVDENKEFEKYRRHIFEGFEYNMSYREVLIYTTLGKRLCDQSQTVRRKLNVLDVGSGKLLTAKKLIQNTSFVHTYTSIDNQIDANDHADDMKRFVVDFEFRFLDILRDEFSTDTKYDVVIIDVEPHGKEIDVYERVKHTLADSHLCILKHVGFIDLFGSCLADRFMTKYEDLVSDYYGESVGRTISRLHKIRDVFILFDRNTKTTNIRDLLTCDPAFRYVDDGIKMFCKCTKRSCS